MKFPSIEQYRHVIRRVSDRAKFVGQDEQGNAILDHAIQAPVVRAIGTVKLHGTNAGVTLGAEGNLECWSRTQVITVDNDNQGFAKFVATREPVLRSLLTPGLTVYGEWCGKGIQKGCGIHALDKMFVIFAARYTAGEVTLWAEPNELLRMSCPDQSIYSIHSFPTFEMAIDFNSPGESQNKLIDLTLAVEAECPVAKKFGVSGVGEGIVWTLCGPEYGSSYWFKVKGEKHSVTRVKKLVEVDVERVARAKEFAEMTVTEARCLQGISLLPEVTQKQTGPFLKWVAGDILKEESDRLGGLLNKKDVTKRISTLARVWFFKYLDKQVGL